MRRRFGWLTVLAALLPAGSGAVQITSTGVIDRRGVIISQFHCIEYGIDPESQVFGCLNYSGPVVVDLADSSELAFETSHALPGVAAVEAQHASAITATTISASGSISVEVESLDPDVGADALSIFELSFALDERAAYQLTATLRRPGVPAFARGFAWVRLCTLHPLAPNVGCGFSVIVNELLNEPPLTEVQLDESGWLDPGAYYLRVQTGSQGGPLSAASFDFALEFTDVPEPASLWLLAGALCALATAQSRRRR